VRSVLVPALAITLGARFWWPSSLARGGERRLDQLAREPG
jgi:uncharacterized membrane protein YdfJ with MMPL/SSD domain